MNHVKSSQIYDFVFIGLGASNSLILLSLIRKDLIKDKKIAVFEPESKSNNDKTYCFWAHADSSIVNELGSIISKSFNSISVNNAKTENIETCPYHYIRSIDLYNLTTELLQKAKVEIHRQSIKELTTDNSINAVHTENGTFYSRFVFDSRPPTLSSIPENEIYLHQSFLGWHVKTEKNVFLNDTFEMMNFNIGQDKFTQFMYVIPFSENEALVEFTRFGAEKIELSYASTVLNDYIIKEFGEFEKLEEEIGCIPMTTFFNPSNQNVGVLNTGASANLIKPSTGYGFKKMFEFAQLVTERLEATDLNKFNQISLPSKARFKFYDRLLLMILLHWPSNGKKIFSRLFSKHSSTSIFLFLDEKTTLFEEIKIFLSLPIKPFLKALSLDFRNKGFNRYLFGFIIVLIYNLLYSANIDIAHYFNYLSLLVGLLWVGIPHGALDHLLTKNKKTSLFSFIASYLLVVCLYLLLWQFLPFFSLLVFVVYSSFHFGESELIQNKESIKTFKEYLKAFAFGFTILTFIISTHLEESINIIHKMTNVSDLFFLEINRQFIQVIISIVSFSFILVQYLQSKKSSIVSLLLLLIAGIFVPLMLAFGLYFILQHSYNAWTHLQKGLQLNSMELHKKSALFTVGAVLIFVTITFLVRDSSNLQALLTNFFVFIACISFPHFVLMHLFYKSKC